MKPEIFARVRHDIDEPTNEQDAINKLAELNTFLSKVKPSARLRAKNQGGMNFLHTRTGTIFGRFLKWLTIGWPNAIQQREQAKILVKNILSKVDYKSDEAKNLKNKILQETLDIKKFSEFNIFELKNQLRSLQYLIERDSKEDSGSSSEKKEVANSSLLEDSEFLNKPYSPGQKNSVIADHNDFHYEYGVARLKPIERDNYDVNDLLIESDSEQDAEDEITSLLKEDAKEKPAPVPQGNDLSDSSLNEVPDTSSLVAMPDESAKPAEPPESPVPEVSAPPQQQSQANPLDQLSPDNADIPISGKPAESKMPAVEEKSRFGCYEIKSPLSATKVHKIGDYQADVYIMPGATDDLRFNIGNSHFDLAKDLGKDLRLVTGTHSYHDENRTVKKLLLSPIRTAEEGLVKTMLEEKQKQYHEALHARYTDALDHAFKQGAKTIAIKPLIAPFQIVPGPEIEVLAQAIAKFQQTHAGVNVQVVFTRDREVQDFNQAIANLATSH